MVLLLLLIIVSPVLLRLPVDVIVLKGFSKIQVKFNLGEEAFR